MISIASETVDLAAVVVAAQPHRLRGERAGGERLGVVRQTPLAGLAQEVTEIVQEAGEHHLVVGVVGSGLQRVIQHRHPLAVGLVSRGGQKVQHDLDEQELAAQQ